MDGEALIAQEIYINLVTHSIELKTWLSCKNFQMMSSRRTINTHQIVCEGWVIVQEYIQTDQGREFKRSVIFPQKWRENGYRVGQVRTQLHLCKHIH